ncbi:TetR/AcrR family transcriptional regulator [Desulfitobacterium sp. THU1]|uniref:TetR/AcrR family transcriptional regulator n=1 Tax=Desulfitobacterium sp. THU1 TaxID=3138072 RepID=UPI00311E4724
MPSRRDKKREELRERIVSTAIRLFQTQSFKSTTMEQISEVCDIARGTLYNHFSNKESIIKEYLKLTMRDRESEIVALLEDGGSTHSQLLKALMKINEWNENNKEVLRMHTSSCYNEMFTRGKNHSTGNLYNTLLRIIYQGQIAGELRSDISPESLTKHLSALYTQCFLEWISGEKPNLGKHEMEEMLQLFFFGAAKQS